VGYIQSADQLITVKRIKLWQMYQCGRSSCVCYVIGKTLFRDSI